MSQVRRATMPIVTSPASTAVLTEVDVKRKGIQRGTLFLRGGVWHVAFRKYMPTGNGDITYRQTSESTRQTSKRAARRVADEIVAKANAPAECPRGTSTVTAFVETFFWPQHVMKLKPGGIIHYRTIWDNHVKPSIGDTPMNEVTPAFIQRLLTQKHMTGLSASSLTHIRNVIGTIFGFGRAMGYFKGDLPTAGLSLPRGEKVMRQALQPEQVEAILSHLGGAKDQALQYRVLVILLANTGLRIGEALGLSWEHIDFDRKMIIVGRSWGRGTIRKAKNSDRMTCGQGLTSTKNGRVRVVPMISKVEHALQALREMTPASAASGFVFLAPGSKMGRPLDAHNFSAKIFKPACVAAGVPWASVHCLRHTLATEADKAGLTMAERMQVLGHSSAAVTMGYTHATADAVRRKLEKVN